MKEYISFCILSGDSLVTKMCVSAFSSYQDALPDTKLRPLANIYIVSCPTVKCCESVNYAINLAKQHLP